PTRPRSLTKGLKPIHTLVIFNSRLARRWWNMIFEAINLTTLKVLILDRVNLDMEIFRPFACRLLEHRRRKLLSSLQVLHIKSYDCELFYDKEYERIKLLLEG